MDSLIMNFVVFPLLFVLTIFAAYCQILIINDLIEDNCLPFAAFTFFAFSLFSSPCSLALGLLTAEILYQQKDIEQVAANWGPKDTVYINKLEIKHMNPSGYVTTMDGEVIKYSLLSIKGSK